MENLSNGQQFLRNSSPKGSGNGFGRSEKLHDRSMRELSPTWVAAGVAALAVSFYVTPSPLLAVGMLGRAIWSLRKQQYLTANLCLLVAAGFAFYFRWQQVPESPVVLRRSILPVYKHGTTEAATYGLESIELFGTRCQEPTTPGSIERDTARGMIQMLQGNKYEHLLLEAIDAAHRSADANSSLAFCANVAFMRTLSKLDSCPALSTFLGIYPGLHGCA